MVSPDSHHFTKRPAAAEAALPREAGFFLVAGVFESRLAAVSSTTVQAQKCDVKWLCCNNLLELKTRPRGLRGTRYAESAGRCLATTATAICPSFRSFARRLPHPRFGAGGTQKRVTQHRKGARVVAKHRSADDQGTWCPEARLQFAWPRFKSCHTPASCRACLQENTATIKLW